MRRRRGTRIGITGEGGGKGFDRDGDHYYHDIGRDHDVVVVDSRGRRIRGIASLSWYPIFHDIYGGGTSYMNRDAIGGALNIGRGFLE
jgi:hypothetical protein